MWVFRYARFVRVWQGGKRKSARSQSRQTYGRQKLAARWQPKSPKPQRPRKFVERCRRIGSVLLLLITTPILIAQVAVIVVVVVVVVIITISLPRTFGELARAYRVATSNGKADRPSKHTRGGEVRQAGYHKKISATRYGASTRSGDLRRRLNELRSMRTWNPAHRPQNLGSQYGKHKK